MGIDFSANMANVISLLGSEATLKRKTSSINKYGDNDPTYVNETITVGVNDINDETSWEKYGIFNPEDKIFFIKASVTKPEEGDQIIHRGLTYEIKKVQAPDSGYISHYECGAQTV